MQKIQSDIMTGTIVSMQKLKAVWGHEEATSTL